MPVVVHYDEFWYIQSTHETYRYNIDYKLQLETKYLGSISQMLNNNKVIEIIYGSLSIGI